MALDKGHADAGGAVPSEWALLEALVENSHDVIGVFDATGIFLSIVHGIVHRHHGTLDIASESGKGTTLTLRFSLDPAPPDGEPSPPSRARPRPLRVLLVEDEPVVRTVVKEFLASDGHSVVTAADGEEGCRKYGEGDFDLVISDHAMPLMTGLGLAAAIRKPSRGTPFLLLTGFGDLFRESGDMPEDADGVATKPVTREGLRLAIEAVIGKRGGRGTEGGPG